MKPKNRLELIEQVLKNHSIENAFSIAAEISLLVSRIIYDEKKRKITWDQLLELRDKWNKGWTLQSLASEYDCSVGSIQIALKEFKEQATLRSSPIAPEAN